MRASTVFTILASALAVSGAAIPGGSEGGLESIGSALGNTIGSISGNDGNKAGNGDGNGNSAGVGFHGTFISGAVLMVFDRTATLLATATPQETDPATATPALTVLAPATALA